MPRIPEGSGSSPVVLVVISANALPESSAFYAEVFGWKTAPLSAELSAALTPAPPAVTLRAGSPAGFPSMVPFVQVQNVPDTLARVVQAGGEIERAPWTMPGVGQMARFRDPSGTIYGITTALASSTTARVPMPIQGNPKPVPHTVCHLEMYAVDRAVTAESLAVVFGWGCCETMPNYSGFDPGSGVGGVLQSHTPGTTALAYVYVDDVAAKLAEIETAGGARLSEPLRVPGMATFGYFRDPSKSSMGLIGP